MVITNGLLCSKQGGKLGYDMIALKYLTVFQAVTSINGYIFVMQEVKEINSLPSVAFN